MLKSDVLDFLKDVKRLYPSWKIDDYQGTVDIWFRYLENNDKDYIYKALDEYVTIERNQFAPSVSDIINLAKKYKPDPRFEGMEYWERRIHSIYPYKSNWDHKLFCEWYTDDRECQQLYRYLTQGIDRIERKLCPESVIDTLEKLINKYEDDKKCLTMKKV